YGGDQFSNSPGLFS
ncbi:hypothetical protein D041_0436B, partial [Vibrio parahaemolyticus EKP-008]